MCCLALADLLLVQQVQGLTLQPTVQIIPIPVEQVTVEQYLQAECCRLVQQLKVQTLPSAPGCQAVHIHRLPSFACQQQCQIALQAFLHTSATSCLEYHGHHRCPHQPFTHCLLHDCAPRMTLANFAMCSCSSTSKLCVIPGLRSVLPFTGCC